MNPLRHLRSLSICNFLRVATVFSHSLYIVKKNHRRSTFRKRYHKSLFIKCRPGNYRSPQKKETATFLTRLPLSKRLRRLAAFQSPVERNYWWGENSHSSLLPVHTMPTETLAPIFRSIWKDQKKLSYFSPFFIFVISKETHRAV